MCPNNSKINLKPLACSLLLSSRFEFLTILSFVKIKIPNFRLASRWIAWLPGITNDPSGLPDFSTTSWTDSDCSISRMTIFARNLTLWSTTSKRQRRSCMISAFEGSLNVKKAKKVTKSKRRSEVLLSKVHSHVRPDSKCRNFCNRNCQ